MTSVVHTLEKSGDTQNVKSRVLLEQAPKPGHVAGPDSVSYPEASPSQGGWFLMQV